MSLNGTEICKGGTEELSSDAVGFNQTIEYQAKYELEEISTLQFSVNGTTASAFTPEKDDAVCVYGAKVSGTVSFPSHGDYVLEYSIATGSRSPLKKMCTITITGKLCIMIYQF